MTQSLRLSSHGQRETLFITTASLLSVFNIFPALDQDENPVVLSAETTDGLLS